MAAIHLTQYNLRCINTTLAVLHNTMKNQIQHYRLLKGITQVDLAKKIRVSQQAIAKWEKEDTNVSLEYVPRLEKALGVRKEVLFPDLRTQSPVNKKTLRHLEEDLEYILPHEIIIHFKRRSDTYHAEISGKFAESLSETFFNGYEERIISFETLRSMIVVINCNQVRRIEIGRDLAYLPSQIIQEQVLGENNPEFEECGDDRHVRMFFADCPEPIIEYPNPDEDYDSLSVVYDAVHGLYNLQTENEFGFFRSNCDDEAFRDIFFRSDDLELIEAPIVKFNEYIKRIDRHEISTETKKRRQRPKNKG